MKSSWPIDFTKEEIFNALKHMHPTNPQVPPDSMVPMFFLTYWDIIGQEVTGVVITTLNSGIIPTNLNHTFSTLIPKKKSLSFG